MVLNNVVITIVLSIIMNNCSCRYYDNNRRYMFLPTFRSVVKLKRVRHSKDVEITIEKKKTIIECQLNKKKDLIWTIVDLRKIEIILNNLFSFLFD